MKRPQQARRGLNAPDEPPDGPFSAERAPWASSARVAGAGHVPLRPMSVW
ncbi:hypothetical protein [Brachybacterium sacelli]